MEGKKIYCLHFLFLFWFFLNNLEDTFQNSNFATYVVDNCSWSLNILDCWQENSATSPNKGIGNKHPGKTLLEYII